MISNDLYIKGGHSVWEDISAIISYDLWGRCIWSSTDWRRLKHNHDQWSLITEVISPLEKSFLIDVFVTFVFIHKSKDKTMRMLFGPVLGKLTVLIQFNSNISIQFISISKLKYCYSIQFINICNSAQFTI